MASIDQKKLDQEAAKAHNAPIPYVIYFTIFCSLPFVEKIIIVNTNKTLITIYIKISDSDAVSWEKVKDSNEPVEIMYTSNFLFVVIDKIIYISTNGFTYINTGIGENLDITDIDRHKFRITYVSTNQGLYSDNGSFNGSEPVLQEVLLGDLLGTNDTVNCTATNDTSKVVIGISSGSYGLIEGNILKNKGDTSLDSIQNALVINEDLWLFGQDVVKIPDLDYPIRLSTGTPI